MALINKRWDGARFKTGATFRRWTGSAWKSGATVRTWSGSDWIPSLKLEATGGIKFKYGGYIYHVFNSSSTFNVKGKGKIEFLIVGGGGAGGSNGDTGGGGGAGEVVLTPVPIDITSGSYKVTVGAGGVPALNKEFMNTTNGGATVIDGIMFALATGGGGGSDGDAAEGSSGAAGNGGSGGGGSNYTRVLNNWGAPGTITGGGFLRYRTYGYHSPSSSGWHGGGGGGGALTGGTKTVVNGKDYSQSIGGNGFSVSGKGTSNNTPAIFGSNWPTESTGNTQWYFAGGGGGGTPATNDVAYGNSGSGAGGYLGTTAAHHNGKNAANNSGSGGGGYVYKYGLTSSNGPHGGKGGSGRAIIRYVDPG